MEISEQWIIVIQLFIPVILSFIAGAYSVLVQRSKDKAQIQVQKSKDETEKESKRIADLKDIQDIYQEIIDDLKKEFLSCKDKMFEVERLNIELKSTIDAQTIKIKELENKIDLLSIQVNGSHLEHTLEKK